MCAAPDCKRWLRTCDVSGYCGVCAALPCPACNAPGGYWLEHGECKPERPLCHHERALGHRLGIGHVLACEPERDPAYIQRCEALRAEYDEDAHLEAWLEASARSGVAMSAEVMLAQVQYTLAMGNLGGLAYEAAIRAAGDAIRLLRHAWTIEAGASLCRGCAAPEHSGNCKCGDASCERCK